MILPGLSSPQWLSTWIPSLAQALVMETGSTTTSSNHSSRCKQVANFCLPRIEFMVGGSPTSCQFLFAQLLQQLSQQQQRQTTTLDYDDALLWAQLATVQYSGIERYIKMTFCAELRQTIVELFPLERYWEPLTHSLDRIRLVAFQAMEAVVAAHQAKVDAEMDLWKRSFPYNYISERKEFLPMFMKCLLHFLDRISLKEAIDREANVGETSAQSVILPNLHSFVVDFLVENFFLQQAAYPGTTLNKESFGLALLECILMFALQDKQANYSDSNSNLCNNIVQRRRRDSELSTAHDILKSLVNVDVFAALLALLHSVWDATRAEAFSCLCSIVQEARRRNLELPNEFAAPENRKQFQARGLYLASSPRQREADTGARMLSLSYLFIPSAGDKAQFLTDLTTMMEDRLFLIEHHLGIRSSDNISNALAVNNGNIPLVHGILQAVRLITELKGSLGQRLFQTLVSSCILALQISLTVISDVKEGEEIEGICSEEFAQDKESDMQQLNINSGAIGANGTFSSIREKSEGRLIRRFAIQRIVVSHAVN